MRRDRSRAAWGLRLMVGAGVASGVAAAADPAPGPVPPSGVVQVQLPPSAPAPEPGRAGPAEIPDTPTPTSATPQAAPAAPPTQPVTQAAGGGPAPPPSLAEASATRLDVAPASGGAATSVPVAAASAAQALNASDVAAVLTKSASSTGIEVQQRNAIVSDPRVRGLRNNQYLTVGDGALFVPGRLDLDTPVTKFNPSQVRDVIVVKGPFSTLYGPGLAALDVATLDSYRSKTGGFDYHGQTGLTYQTNGQRWDGYQSFWAGEANWGFRITYELLQGNDYLSGGSNPVLVPSSFRSNNYNWAFGFDLTPQSKFEFKGVRVQSNDIEFPGLYFDIGQLDTEAYNGKYTWTPDGVTLSKFDLDVYYNNAVGTGNTAGGQKQAFVQKLLGVSFNPTVFQQFATGSNVTNAYGPASRTVNGLTTVNPNTSLPDAVAVNRQNIINSVLVSGGTVQDAQAAADAAGNQLNLFTDQSTSRFATKSVGYSTAATWGDRETGQLITGTDLRVVGQGLQENILFRQVSGRDPNTAAPVNPGAGQLFGQNQSVPNSNSVNPGLFFQGDQPLTDRWKMTYGGRLDWVRTTSHPTLVTGNVDIFGPPGPPTLPNQGRFSVNPLDYSRNPGDPNLDRNFILPAGFLQSRYLLTDELTATLGVGHAERAPSLTELYAAGPFVGVLQQGTSRLFGDPHLKAEKLTELDAGISADYRYFRGGATVFFGWVNDYITYDANKIGPGLTQVVFTNTNLATLAGTELFGELDANDWITPFGTLSFVQGTDQTHSDTTRAGNLASSRRTNPATGQYAADTEPLPQIPPLETLLGIRFHDRSRQKWQVEFSARVVTGQNAVASSLNEFATPGFTVFNIRTFYKPTEALLLTAGVENVGNKQYRAHLDPISGNILNQGALFRPGTNFYFGSQFTY